MVTNIETGRVDKKNERPIGSTLLGKRVLELRNSTGKNQQEFSLEAGLSQGYLSQIENGEVSHLGGQVAIYIARAAGVGYESFEEEPDTKVFIRPEARKLFYLITAPELDVDRKRAIEMTVNELIPKIESPLRYIDVVQWERNPGQIIRESRGEMLQGKLAQIAYVSQGNLSQLENGEVLDTSLLTLLKISKALNIDAGKLLGVKERTYPTAVEVFDRFLRNDDLTDEQKAAILNRFTDVLYLILQIPQPGLETIAEILRVASGTNS